MEVITVTDKDTIAPLFDGWQETMIWSCLQGCMGTAFADHAVHPRSAKICIADFCFYAGVPNEALVRHQTPEERKRFVIMIPQNEGWSQIIESVYGKRATRRERYATKKEPECFNPDALCLLSKALPAGYELRMIDEELFQQVRSLSWAGDLCSQFQDWQDYASRGIGVVALKDGVIASGASSYTVYQGGIEIEIDTKEDERHKGLASACGARLILECLKKGLYPSWDAHNKVSLALAEKLGYHFDTAYPVYEVTGIKSYKAVLYDLDGTVLNTLDMNLYPLLQIIKEETGEDWSFEEVLRFAPYPGIKVMEELGITNPEKVYERWVRYVNEYEKGAVLYEGFRQVFEALKPHVIQAVVSAKTFEQYQIDFVSKGLETYMEAAVLAGDTTKHKPDPEPLLTCLERLGIQAEDAIYIGDAPSDYLAAKRAGMDFGYARWGSVMSDGIDDPEFVFDQPEDLMILAGH